jgi:hypothetical protein
MPYLPVSDEDALARAAALLLGLGFWRAIYPAVVDALLRPWGRHGTLLQGSARLPARA